MSWTPEKVPDQAGKVIIITGASGGLGFEAAKVLAGKGAHVILASRSAGSGNKAVEQIKALTPSAKADWLPLDLGSFKSVQEFVKKFEALNLPLHVLINNAGVVVPPHSKTKEGFEVTMGTNHMGPFLLTQLLVPKLKANAPARIIFLSANTEGQGTIDFDDVGSQKVNHSGLGQVNNSKLSNIMTAIELNKRLQGTSVEVFACHPGISRTGSFAVADKKKYPWLWLFAPIRILLGQPAEKGAYSMIYCATAPELAGKGGTFYGPNSFSMYNTCQRQPVNKLCRDDAALKKLYDESDKLCQAKLQALT